MDRHMNRRDFLKVGGISTFALALGATGAFTLGSAKNVLAAPANEKGGFNGYGPLIKDPGGILDLPEGFQYRIISEQGGKLSDGRMIPGAFDGMAAFQGPNNSTILVRNHELSGNTKFPVEGKNPYDKTYTGGTTALVVGPNRKEYITSAGTFRNCAGGATPWGTWLTCEETLTQGHGYVFEVNPADPEGDLSKTPIREMGAFSHEAAAIEEMSTTSASTFYTGQKFGIIWKYINPEKPNLDAKGKGCIQFSRLEGAYFAGGVFWFDDTSAGQKKLGRIYRYIPATNTLELFYESSEANDLEMPDNICITPWGDLWITEDGGGIDRVIGVTPEGGTYVFAENKLNDSELAGPAFSTDGHTFFVNMQSPGMTFAIWGPFARRNAARQRQMAHAAPPQHFAPQVSNKLASFAQSQGISYLEAAVYHRHGMPIA
jgi:uncharacterized protein